MWKQHQWFGLVAAQAFDISRHGSEWRSYGSALRELRVGSFAPEFAKLQAAGRVPLRSAGCGFDRQLCKLTCAVADKAAS